MAALDRALDRCTERNRQSDSSTTCQRQRQKLTITRGLRVSEEHPCVGHVEHRVGHVRCGQIISDQVTEKQRKAGCRRHTVSTRHATLHDNYLLALPRMEDWHARDGRVGLQGDRVDRVVGADDQRDVGVGEVVVDFVHFENNCIIHLVFYSERGGRNR